MEHPPTCEDSLSSSSSDQPINCQGWERFLPERPLRILLVEEDSSNRQAVCALLSKCGYEVSCAYDGSKAWDLLEQSASTFDLVLADAMIPVLSGTDLLAKIMSSESHRDMPVIMMSAHDSLDMVFKCLLKGAKDFLVKPLRKNELRNLWQHVWRRNHASGGHRRLGYVTKRKTLKNLSLDDVSKDNLSLSTGIDDKFVSENGRDAEVTGVCRSDQRSRPPDVRSEHNQASTPAKEPLFPTDQPAHSEEALEVRAFNFLASPRKEFEEEPVFSEVNLMRHMETSPQICQATGFLDLAKRMNSTDDAEDDSPGKQGVRQSSFSAFSKYTCNTSLVLQPCSVRSQAPSNDQYADGCTPIVLNGDIMGSTTAQNYDKINGVMFSGNGQSTTLHFPKATHFKHRMQAGDSPFLFVSPCCEENSRQVQESSSNFKCPSLNSSTANSFRPTSKGSANDPLKRMDFQKDGRISGSVLRSPGSEKEDFSSSNTKSDRLLPCLNTICMDTDPGKQSLYGQSNMPMNIDESHTYTLVSGRGSNNCSDRGSSMIEEHLTDCGAAQDGHCGNGCWNMSESGRMDLPSGGAHVHDVPNASDQKPMNIDCSRSSFREAALHKFREKRKLRCFEKRVRYQSRKKLAEQRPRIKGQFVRRATFEKAADTKASILT